MVFGYREPFPIDVADEGNYYLVQASLPGINPEDVQVDVYGQTLIIRGEREDDHTHLGRHWIAHERRLGVLERSVTLPTPIKEKQIKACFEHGVLTLVVHKADEALPRRAKTDTKVEMPAALLEQLTPVDAIPHDEADAVIEASIESFPASDPPSWTPQ